MTIFAKKCLVIIFSPLSNVHPTPLSGVWCVSVAGDVTLFLWSLLSQEEFSQQPAGSRGPLNGAQCSALQISHIYRQSAPQWATARPAWPSHCSSRGNFYYIPFLTRWQAEIAEPEPVWCAHGRKYAIPLAGLARSEYLFEQPDCVI